jgi:predicted peptidase
VLSPQCPLNNQWVDTPWGNGTYRLSGVPISDDMQAVVEILDSLFKQYHLDTARQYISGMSMGGYGTWDLAMRQPNRFAAIVPVCGAADTTQANALRNLPIWAFHAADDAVVPVRGSREMIAALRARGGTPTYTEYPSNQGVGHSAWVPAAANPALVPWVFNQSRPPVPVIRPLRTVFFHPFVKLEFADLLGRHRLRLRSGGAMVPHLFFSPAR